MEVYEITEKGMQPSQLKEGMPVEKEIYFIAAKGNEARSLQEYFHFSQETIEKCIHRDDTVRFQSFAQYDFISFKVLSWQQEDFKVKDMNLYVGNSYVILVGEHAEQEIIAITKHVLKNIGSMVQPQAALNKIYFFIFDWVLVNYFENLQKLEEQIGALDEKILMEANQRHFHQIHGLRRQISKARKYIRPLLYIGDEILVNNNNFIQRDMLRYFKNIDIRINKLYDFVLNMQDLAEHLRYTYDSQLTFRINTIATRLTILAVFFGPLTVITGIYGMNFEYMPELNSPYGYPIVLSSMAIVVAVLYYWLKKKNWL